MIIFLGTLYICKKFGTKNTCALRYDAAVFITSEIRRAKRVQRSLQVCRNVIVLENTIAITMVVY
jgi:hypothetical protein